MALIGANVAVSHFMKILSGALILTSGKQFVFTRVENSRYLSSGSVPSKNTPFVDAVLSGDVALWN